MICLTLTESFMDDTELEHLYAELVKEYGDRLPDPLHEPKRFKYYHDLYKRLLGNLPVGEQ
jgi:hypothetical protein